MDQQHKEFFMNANKFVIKARAGKKQAATEEEMDFIVNYLLYHCETEELVQLESQYPDYLNHKAAHQRLNEMVKESSMELKMNAFSSESIEQFYTMLTNWIEQHILKMDLDFATYYKQLNLDKKDRQSIYF